MEGQVWWHERQRSATATATRSRKRQTQTHCRRSGFGHRSFERRAVKKLVKPAAKRTVVQHLQEQHGLSQRRASRLVQCNRITARYITRRSDDDSLRTRLRKLAADSPALGYRMLCG